VEPWAIQLQSGTLQAPVDFVDDRPSGDGQEAELATPQVDQATLLPLMYRQMRSLRPGRNEDIDDLTQTAVEQALRSLPSFEGRSQLATWTYRICYLTLLKHGRWYRRWLRRFTLTHGGVLPEVETGEGPSERLEAAQRAARLRAAIAKLSPKRRAVVVLHDLEGLDIDEVAEVVGANPLTVRSRLRDGRNALSQLLAGDPYFGDEACSEVTS
jgi:RNA polymerase sigma-70 factor, ECF subfamily